VTALTTPMLSDSAALADDLNMAEVPRLITRQQAKPPAYTPDIVDRILGRVRANARRTRIPASIVLGQMLHETNWLRYGNDVQPGQYNFAGIGATGGVPGLSFPTPEAGVDAVHGHHLAYLLGLPANVPNALQDLVAADPRYVAAATSPGGGKVRVVGDYTNGRWAYTAALPVGSLENGYARAIVDGSNALLAGAPAAVQPTGVPLPPIINRYPEDGQGDTGQLIVCTKYGEGFAPVMVSSHITAPPAGALSDHGSLRYLAKSTAEASVHFLIGRAGGIFSGGVPLNKTPWTNGVDWSKGPGPASNPWKSDLSNPYIAECVARRGWFNQLTFTIEHEGYSGDKMTSAQWAATKQLQAWLCAEGRNAAGLPGGPLTPQAQRTLVGHFQFDGINRPNCPGWTAAQWAELEADVRAIIGTGVTAPAGYLALWDTRLGGM
jgi:hypothetical protein